MMNRIKILILIFCWVIASNELYTQKITAFGTDASGFPKVKTSFFAFDETGKPISDPDTLQFRIFENGMERWMKKINCPAPSTPKAISSVLTIDISHSMRDYNRMNIAKSANIAWIKAMSNASSECAVTSFDAFTYINHDFSTNKNSLISAINQLQPKSGTNYTAAFLGDSGAIKLASQGKNKRFIIFLTDGEPDESYPPNPIEIINAAKKNNITIYCIALGLGNSSLLKMLADSTGGKFYGNITSTPQAELTYIMLLQTLEGSSPCTLEWQSDINCGRFRDVAITMPDYYTDTYTSYSLDNKQLPHLLFTSDNNFDFGKVEPGKTAKTKFKITAKLRDIYIGPLSSNNTNFKILRNIQNNTLVTQNSSLDFDIEFSPKDTCKQTCKIDFYTDACSGNTFNYSGGVTCVGPPIIPDSQPKPPLNILFPNGGEELVAGSDTTLLWEGVPKNELMRLDYSTDKGISWNNITNNAINGEYLWKVPSTPSKECLLKVRNSYNNSALLDSSVVFGHGQITSADFSHDGKYAVTRSANGYLIIWDVNRAKVFKKFKNEIYNTHLVAWSSKNKIAFGSRSNNVKIYDLATDQFSEIKTELDGNLTVLSWNPDGNRLACGDNRGKITILNTQYQYVVQTLKEYSSGVQDISWEPTGFDLVSGHIDGKVLIWHMSSGKPVIDYSASGSHSNLVTCVAWSPKGGLIASGGVDHRIIIRTSDGTEIKSLDAHAGRITTLSWNSSGTLLISGSDDKKIKIWNNHGSLLKEFNEHSERIIKVKWKNDDNEYYSAGYDNNIFVRSYGDENIIKGLEGHTKAITGISVNPVIPAYLITIDNSKKLTFWDYLTGEALRSIIDTMSTMTCCSYNEQANKIAIGYENGIIKVFNAGTTNLIRTLGPSDGHKERINSLSWNPDGSGLASGSSDDVIKIWEPNGGTLVGDIYCHNNDVLSVAWSPDGRYLASGGADKYVCISDPSKLKLERTLYDHNSSVTSVNWDADGDSLVSGSSDGTVIIWNTLSPKQARLVKQFAEKFNHSPLVWNPKYNTILSANSSDGALLWDSEFGFIKQKYPLNDGNQKYNSIIAQWDKSGKKVIASSNAGTLHIFHLNGIPGFVQQDTSDALWSIIVPKVISTDVFLGSINVGSDTTKSVYAFLANLTKVPVRVDSIKVKGNDIIHFDLNIPSIPLTLLPFESKTATFTFHPESIGEKSCTFTIYTQNETLEHTVSGIGVDKSYTTYIIDFGEIEMGEFSDTTANLIRNNGMGDVFITKVLKNGNNCENFIIDETKLQPFNLQAKADFLTDIRFLPDKPGSFSCKIDFYPDNEIYPATAILTGRGVINNPTINVFKSDTLHLLCDDYLIDTLVIQNLGRRQLIINSVSFRTNESSAFEIISYPIYNLDSAVIDFVVIKFNPKNAGTYKAQLEIINNSTNEPMSLIDIAGIKDSVGYKLSNRKIIIGPLCPNETTKATFSIENTGILDNNYYISSDSIINIINSNVFISKNNKDLIEFEITATNDTDTLEKMIFVTDSICSKWDTLLVELIIEKPKLYTQNIIISASWGTIKNGKMGISNFSNRDITIDSIVATEIVPIQLITNVQGMILSANTTEEIEFQYSAIDTLPCNTTFLMYASPCNIIEYLSVMGMPDASETTLSIDTIYASNNEKITIPLHFDVDDSIKINNDYVLNIQISFNSSLLYPLGNIKSELSNYNNKINSRRTIFVSIPGSEINKELVLPAEFLVMLGNSDRTEIAIDTAYFDSGFISVNTKNGMLILNDVCSQGGLQLVESVNNLRISSIHPNPAKDIIIINYFLHEAGNTDIILFNSLGQEVKKQNIPSAVKGFNNVSINTEELSNGTYFCVLRNANQNVTEVLKIIK